MAKVTHPELGIIECVRSLRSRSIRLSMRRDMTLRLSYPLFCSQREAIAFAESRREWIELTRKRISERVSSHPTISQEEVIALRKEARKDLPERVVRLAAEYGFRYSSLRISSARTRWGSCSARNGISLSIFVMTLPEHLRDFIILHELCHTRYHNHSEAFHTLLNSCVAGRERELNGELRRWPIPNIE